MSTDSKGVADEPAPRTIRLLARDLDRVQGHLLGRRYVPLGMHQRNVAGLDDLLDMKVKCCPRGSKGRQGTAGGLSLAPFSPSAEWCKMRSNRSRRTSRRDHSNGAGYGTANSHRRRIWARRQHIRTG